MSEEKKTKVLTATLKNKKGHFTQWKPFINFVIQNLLQEKNKTKVEELKKFGANIVKLTPSSENTKKCFYELKNIFDIIIYFIIFLKVYFQIKRRIL